MVALARRAVACPGWRWLEGCVDMAGCVYLGQFAHGDMRHTWAKHDRGSWAWAEPEFNLPDLSHPATLGCLLHLVREAWSQPVSAAITTRKTYEEHSWPQGGFDDDEGREVYGFWTVDPWPHPRVDMYALEYIRVPTEAEALVRALELAPQANG